MPIRPENKDRYPKEWPEISLRIRQRSGWKCEYCKVPNNALGGRTARGVFLPAHPLGEGLKGIMWPFPGEWGWCGKDGMRPEWCRIIKIVLTVAHMDHTPENCSDENLKALCQRCHNIYDAPHRRAGIRARERIKMAIGDLF